MNYSTAVMLFNDEIRAVRVSYDPNDKINDKPRDYLFKTLDPDLKTGDYDDEQKWIAEMKKAQNRKKKEDIKKNMVDMYQANGASLEVLAIAGRKSAPTCAAITETTDE